MLGVNQHALQKINSRTYYLYKIKFTSKIAAQYQILEHYCTIWFDTETVCKVFNNKQKIYGLRNISTCSLTMNPNKSFVIELETPSTATLINRF